MTFIGSAAFLTEQKKVNIQSETLDWKTSEHTITQFAAELGQTSKNRAITAIGHKADRFEFTDEHFLHYRFQIAKPYPEYGSGFQVQTPCDKSEIVIKAIKRLFQKPKLAVSGQISSEADRLLHLLIKKLSRFSITADGKSLFFKTKAIDMNKETMMLIRQIVLELKEGVKDEN